MRPKTFEVVGAAAELGGTDCETLREGLITQPVAAVSSLAYLAAGGWLLWRWRRLPPGDRWPARSYAGLLVAVGVGSAVYHGPQGAGAEQLHDIPIALVLAQAAVVPVSRLVRHRPVIRPGARRRVLAAAAVTATAGAAYLMGRTNSPTCDPDSLVQPHALWHVLGATALTLWGTALWPQEEAAVEEEATS